MPPLPPPIDLLELPDQGVLVTRVERWEEGTSTITPKGAAASKQISVIRIHVPAADKPTVPHYWDITATRLHPALRASLDDVVRDHRWIRIQKFGVAPAARFSLEVKDAAFAGPAAVSS